MSKGPRRIALLVIALSVTALLAAPAADATITASTITSPTDGSRIFDNEITAPGGTFTVAGTTNSTATGTDTVDIDCYNGGSEVVRYEGPGDAGISLANDGSFNAAVPLAPLSGNTCELLAVPHGTTPPPSGYSGPRVAISQLTRTAVLTGPNVGKLYDFAFDLATMHGSDYVYSSGDCGTAQELYDGGAAMNASPYLLNCGGSFYGSSNSFYTNPTTVDLARSEIQVDGANAYNPNSANALFTGASGLTGFPTLTVTLSGNPTTAMPDHRHRGDRQVCAERHL